MANGSAFSARTGQESRTSCGCSPASRWPRLGHGGLARGSCRADSPRPMPTPTWTARTLVDLLWHGEPGRDGVDRGRAIGALRRYGLQQQADQTFGSLSGGQQARFQILLLELSGTTLLLLDEPTDNLDVISAEALEEALQGFDGTVLAVTHDRWFARSFQRFLVFGADGAVYESDEPVFDEARVNRPAP